MAFAIALVSLYFLSGAALLVQGGMQLALIRSARNQAQPAEPSAAVPAPEMLIQLPLYNERTVVERLLEAVVQLKWPGNLTVQILDDSNDGTSQVVADWLVSNPQLPHWYHLRRSDRKGFKAGALAEGLQAAPNAEWIAIFDADFLPPSDFLLRAGAALQENVQLAAVQARWEHLNPDFNALTRVQSFNLDAHFTVEQQARSNMGGWAAFNGTAGIWRRKAIEEAGGWCADTLAEDFDLSVRVHLKGWGIAYLDEVAAPAELPDRFSAYAAQQHRWTAGGAGCARKHARSLFKLYAGKRRFHGLGQLFSSSIHVPVWLMTTVSVPLVGLESMRAGWGWVLPTGAVFAAALLVLVSMYYVTHRRRGGSSWFAGRMLGMLLLGTGMTWRNVKSVWHGWRGTAGGFVRTPKGGAAGSKQGGSWLPEAGWAVYFSVGLGLGLYTGEWGLMPYHALLATGYGWVATMAWRE